MNLIEKYGSYDAAKAKQQELSKIAADPQLLLVGKIIKEIGEIEIALLEYRRQHNIFEVGDKVVIKAEPFWPEDYIIQTVGQEHIGKWYMAAWKHATDAEIKAGRRL